MPLVQEGQGSVAADLAARVISYLISPLLVPIMTTGIFLFVLDAGSSQALPALSFIGLAFTVVPLINILWMVSQGFATSLDLPEKGQRTAPLSVVIICGLIGLVFYTSSESAIDLITILAWTYVANAAVVLVINLFWKISVHAIAVSGMLSVTLYLVGPVFGLAAPFEGLLIAVLVLLVPLVMWARLQLQVHTAAQVVIGAGLGFVGHWAGFYFGTWMLF